MYPHVKDILDEMTKEAKEEMKALPDDQLGSWKRAVTTGDGVWLTRGHYSQNFTYTLRNYMTGALLYVVHKCQRGEDKIIEEPLYEGTSSGAEGNSADKVFYDAKCEGISIEVHWQDDDSTSSAAIRVHFPDEKKPKNYAVFRPCCKEP